MPEHEPYQQWDDSVRLECASIYAVSGNLRATSRQTQVPLTTLQQWSTGKSDPNGVFLAHVERCRTERTAEFVGMYESIAERSAQRLSERLDNDDGDISARDLAWVSAVAIDKSRLLQNKATTVRATEGVAQLAEMFERLSQQTSGRITHTIEPEQEQD